MSLNDWQKIYECLRSDINSYVDQPNVRPEAKKFILSAINICLDTRWIDFIAETYKRFVPKCKTENLFPYVQYVHVSAKSGAAEFTSFSEPCNLLNTPNVRPIANLPKNGIDQLKSCRVLLPKLSALSRIPIAQKLSMSSTPLIRNASNIVIPIGNDVSVIADEPMAIDASRNETQDESHRNTRKRLFDQITTTPANHVLKSTRKKRKIRLSPSQHLQSARKNRRKLVDKSVKKTRVIKATKKPNKKKDKVEVIVEPIAKPIIAPIVEMDLDNSVEMSLVNAGEEHEEWRLDAMAIDDVLASFNSCNAHLTKLFTDYLKQTDETVKRAGDYNPMDVMAMISHEQFGPMADVLYENFITVGDIDCGPLFLELLVPEWILAIFMDKLKLSRSKAIECIAKRIKLSRNQSRQSSIIKLDDSSQLENITQPH